MHIEKKMWRRYLMWFAHEHVDFRHAEINSILSIFNIPIKYIEQPCVQKPYWVVELPSEDCVKKIASRSVLLKSCIELWSRAKSQSQLHINLRNSLQNSTGEWIVGDENSECMSDTHLCPKELIESCCTKKTSFKVEVETFCKHFTMKEKVEKIEAFDYLPFEGPVKLKNPDVTLSYLEFYGVDPNNVPEKPYDVFFGKWVADGQRDLIQVHSLKKRQFIGNTSMDAQLSIIMANQAQVRPGDLVLDPFVGSGSLLVPAAHFGELNDREQDLLQSDIEISNLPEEKGENVLHIVELVARKLGVSLEARDIIYAERVGPVTDGAREEGAGARGRCIVVRLAQRGLRDQLLRGARVRRTATSAELGFAAPPRRFYLNERLTRANKQLFYRVRKAAGLHNWRYTWTKHGRILARQADGGRTHVIRSATDLERVFRCESARNDSAHVWGSDIDYMMLHSRTRPTRVGQKVRAKDESIRGNMKQYGVESRYLDVVVSDFSMPMWRPGLKFDAIITDPPYGVREPTERIGIERENYSLTEDHLVNHVPAKVEYGLPHLYSDLIAFAARHLDPGRRLVCWYPLVREEYNEDQLPRHPCFELVSNSEQVLSKLTARRLLTYQKVHDDLPLTPVDSHAGAYNFREKYFSVGEVSRRERKERKAEELATNPLWRAAKNLDTVT